MFHFSFQLGVRTSDNRYTCPMLSVHLYRKSLHQGDIIQDGRVITTDSNNEQQSFQGPQQRKREERSTTEEEVIMIPLEDVTIISSKLEVEQGIEADSNSKTEYIYKESENCCDTCYAGLLGCCRKTRDYLCCCCQKEKKVAPLVVSTITVFTDKNPNRITGSKIEHITPPEEKEDCCTRCCNPFRCWCCRKKKLVDIIKRTDTVAEQRARRVMTISIDYSKYSNLDSASNARLLSTEQQLAYYKDNFKPDTKLKFYLVNNTEVDSSNFELKKKQAETLCRTVMQLKAMRNFYPSEDELEKILDQSLKRTFGDIFYEPVLQLSLNSTTTESADASTCGLPPINQQRRIGHKPTTTSEEHAEAEKKVDE